MCSMMRSVNVVYGSLVESHQPHFSNSGLVRRPPHGCPSSRWAMICRQQPQGQWYIHRRLVATMRSPLWWEGLRERIVGGMQAVQQQAQFPQRT